ncbi:MAG: serine hydroxymethyltransferase, partial [Pseudomonadota bacterium]|nr:serine hydroxymethyltransferase [Pseudomonadota bacterium]
ITGKDAEDLLGSLNITVNKNSIPNDPQSPFVTSGIRIGTPAITTRGFKNNEAILVANLICDAIEGKDQTSELDNIKKQVDQLCKNFPVYR